MTKTDYCEALDYCAESEESVAANTPKWSPLHAQAKRRAALLRTLKERIERGVEITAWSPGERKHLVVDSPVSDLPRGEHNVFIIDWSGREGEAG